MALNEETAAASTLAPDTGRPLTTQEKWRFGIGFGGCGRFLGDRTEGFSYVQS